MSDRLLFFCADPDDRRPAAPATSVEFQFWTPSLKRIKPPASPAWPFVVWTALHALHVFSSRDYRILLALENGELLHRSCIFPRFYRFPFMNERDLQVGDVWTAPVKRGKGLAGIALAEVLARFPDRRIWYITEESNAASVAVARKAGMHVHGMGERTRPAGIGAIGQFRLCERTDGLPSAGR